MAGEDDGLFGGNADEELQKWIPVLLFHIPVFIFSFTVCIFVVLVLLLCTFFFFCYFSSFKYNIHLYYVSFCVFSCESYFVCLLHWNKYTCFSFFYMSVFILTCLHVHCIFGVATLEETCWLDRKMNCSVQQQRVMWYNLRKGIPTCAGKLNIQTRWGHIILD
jgi:hypothetical protein